VLPAELVPNDHHTVVGPQTVPDVRPGEHLAGKTALRERDDVCVWPGTLTNVRLKIIWQKVPTIQQAVARHAWTR
jgi:hypothetical protein